MKQGKIYFYNPCGERPAEMKKIERRWRLDHFHTSIVQYGYWLMLGDGCSHQGESMISIFVTPQKLGIARFCHFESLDL